MFNNQKTIYKVKIVPLQHYARIDEKSQIALHAKMPYIFENYTQM